MNAASVNTGGGGGMGKKDKDVSLHNFLAYKLETRVSIRSQTHDFFERNKMHDIQTVISFRHPLFFTSRD